MKLAIAGDVSVTESNEKYFAEQNVKILFNDVPSVWKDCDRVIVNLETAITDKNTPIKKFGPNLKAPFGTVETLKEAGVTDLTLSNNHIFDFGKAGLKDTVSEIKKNGLSFTGIGENYLDSRKNLVLSDGKIKVAIINVCEHEFSYALDDRVGARPYDEYDTPSDVEQAKKQNDYVIVIYHGGKEHCQHPSPRLHKLCHALVNHGADVILCQHSHCIGCYEKYLDGHILYGQGNFHFVYDEETSRQKNLKPFWHQGLVAIITLERDVKIKFVACKDNGTGIELLKGREKEVLTKEFNERNQMMKDGTFLSGWREFCHQPTYYDGIVKEGKEALFAHFLDCEAHSDVLRELFPTYNLTNEK